MIIVHSSNIPFFWVDEVGPYVIEDGIRRDLPKGTNRQDILWFQRPYKGGKNEALKIDQDWDVKGNGGRNYKVKLYDDSWSCDCHAFKFSFNKKECKHIKDIQTNYV